MSVTAFETCSLDVLVDTRSATVNDLFLTSLLCRDRMRVILDDIAERLDVPIAGVNLVREDAVLFAAATGAPGWLDAMGGVPAEWAPCHRVADQDTPLTIGDLHADTWGYFSPASLFGPVRAYTGVPLRAYGLVVGTLYTMAQTPDAFGADTVAALENRADEVLHILIPG
ncbi:GAF domain-containing protein [Actinoplanes sp. HUAS TT8]|uniref:GAF domain-containing protein n=1 Tax=Actinoplanes sp. HUAS TT8 TaxID=3447453 RepID=UPI003F5228F0